MVQPFAIDSITASVVQGALENIAVEMGYKLMRMSYSSIIRESEDFGAALVDAEGRGLAESAQTTPSGSYCGTTFASPTLLSAIWRRRLPRHGSAPSGSAD